METLKNKIEKTISKKLKFYSYAQFELDAKKYIAAIESGRMCCIIHSVSASGMNRVLSFRSCEQHDNLVDTFSYRQYDSLFIALGYSEAKNGGFKISGCGMDMVFATHYNITRDLCTLELITKEQCNVLEQKTPTRL